MALTMALENIMYTLQNKKNTAYRFVNILFPLEELEGKCCYCEHRFDGINGKIRSGLDGHFTLGWKKNQQSRKQS